MFCFAKEDVRLMERRRRMVLGAKVGWRCRDDSDAKPPEEEEAKGESRGAGGRLGVAVGSFGTTLTMGKLRDMDSSLMRRCGKVRFRQS